MCNYIYVITHVILLIENSRAQICYNFRCRESARETKQTSATQTGPLRRRLSHGACDAKWMITSSFAA